MKLSPYAVARVVGVAGTKAFRTREFSDQSLSKQALSDLLWARLRHQSPKRRSNRPVLAGSPDQQFVTFAQTVGYARG
jgi:hypothetical protein